MPLHATGGASLPVEALRAAAGSIRSRGRGAGGGARGDDAGSRGGDLVVRARASVRCARETAREVWREWNRVQRPDGFEGSRTLRSALRELPAAAREREQPAGPERSWLRPRAPRGENARRPRGGRVDRRPTRRGGGAVPRLGARSQELTFAFLRVRGTTPAPRAFRDWCSQDWPAGVFSRSQCTNRTGEGRQNARGDARP